GVGRDLLPVERKVVELGAHDPAHGRPREDVPGDLRVQTPPPQLEREDPGRRDKREKQHESEARDLEFSDLEQRGEHVDLLRSIVCAGVQPAWLGASLSCASCGRSRASSLQSESARNTAPIVIAMSARLKMGQRRSPSPTSIQSVTPRGLTIRFQRLPSAPPTTSDSANRRARSRSGVVMYIATSAISATTVRTRKPAREYSPSEIPNAAPGL